MTNKIRSLTLEFLSNIEDLQTKCVQMYNQSKRIDMPTSLFAKIKYFLINCKNGIRELWVAGHRNQKFHWKEILQNLLSIKFLRARIQEFIKPPEDNSIDLFNTFFEKIKQEILDFIQKMSPIDEARPAMNVEIFRKCLTLANAENFGDLLDKIFMLTEEMKKTSKLKEVSNKIFLIIKKHRDLLVLQEQIVKAPVSSAKKNWDLLRKFVRSGLISKNLHKITSKAEKRSLPFKAIIPIPNDPKVINIYSLIDAINRLAPEYREAGQWLFNHLTVFSFKELCNSIKSGCDSLKEDIIGFEGYHLLTVTNKSQGYMANMAMRYLPKKKLPESFLEINWIGQGLRNILNNAKHKNVILFDDASYSGTQIATLLDTLNSNSHYAPFSTAINLYIVVGFISDVAKKKIEDSMTKIMINNTYVEFPLRVKLICQRFYQGIAEQMESELIDESLKEKIKKICGNINKTLVTTEWKMPDFMSTPYYVTRGESLCYFTKYTMFRKFYTNVEQAEKEEFPEFTIYTDPFEKCETPINDIVPPYRKTPKG